MPQTREISSFADIIKITAMKRLIFLSLICVSILGNAQFTYFAESTGDIIAELTNPQKVGTLNSFAEGKSLTFVSHNFGVPQAEGRELYRLFRQVNSETDRLMLKYPGSSNYSALLDSLEVDFASEDILRSWLDAIVTKKVDYCTDPEVLEPLNNSEKWNKYLELLRE